MKDNFDEMKMMWNRARKALPGDENASVEDLIQRAHRHQRKSIASHDANIIILLITLGVIVYFFSYFLGMQAILSRLGLGMMYGGLIVRIGVEIYSRIYARRIDMSHTTLLHTEQNRKFYRFRRKIHGTFTLSIVVMYTLGFYLLTPEFTLYLDMHWVVLFDLSYVVIAILLVWQIRKGIKEEIGQLEEINRIRQALIGEGMP